MNKLFQTLGLLAALAFVTAACIPPVVDVARAAPSEAGYQAMLGRPVSDDFVADFILNNGCSPAGSFQLCPSAGLAFWTGEDLVVETAYLYLDNSAGFAAYRGELPLGLVRQDTMADVEQRLGQPIVEHAPQAGWEPGLPDGGGSPDRIHYWAIYERFGLTVIYNSPSPGDANATIHAVLVSK